MRKKKRSRVVRGCWSILRNGLAARRWWKRSLAHIHVGFFKGGKPEVSAGGEDAFKARTAIHNRSHWRWMFRSRYRHTSIRKSAMPTARKNVKVTQEPKEIFSATIRTDGVSFRTMFRYPRHLRIEKNVSHGQSRFLSFHNLDR